MEVGQDLRLKIFIGSGLSRIIEAGVRVVWRQFKKGAGYRIGARFIHLPSEEMKKLKVLLEHLMKPKPRKDLKDLVVPLDLGLRAKIRSFIRPWRWPKTFSISTYLLRTIS
jgi:hypothetical protein